jgi:uncharacterized membrane-anchored protein
MQSEAKVFNISLTQSRVIMFTARSFLVRKVPQAHAELAHLSRSVFSLNPVVLSLTFFLQRPFGTAYGQIPSKAIQGGNPHGDNGQLKVG